MEFNYYEILGLNRNASDEEIKTAFKKLAKKYHPDKHAGNLVYEEHFKKINTAYQTLSNVKKRQQYDLKKFYKSQKYSSGNSPSYQTKPRVNKRPMKKTYTPTYNKKQTLIYATLTGSALVLFITGAIYFYHYMNAVTAKDHLEEGLRLEAQNKDMFAMEHFSAAISYDESLTEAFIQRGNLRIKIMKDFTGAAGDYSKALKHKEDAALYFKRAKCYLKLKRYEEGMTDLDKAIELNPTYDSLHYYKGEVNNYILKNYEAAIKNYEKVTALNNKFTEAILGKALSKQSLMDYEESIKDFNTLIQLKPENGSYFYYRAYSKMALKDTSAACNDWFQAEKFYFSESRKMINQYCK